MYRLRELRQKQETVYTHFFNANTDIDKTNRWVVLAELIPWVDIEERYQTLFVNNGRPTISIRVALGALIIKEKLNLTDEETVAQISENPYLQYFLGFDQFILAKPFNSSSLTHFRKRFTPEVMAEINEMIIAAQKNDNDDDTTSQGGKQEDESHDAPANSGDLILDATCVPADIHYPTDITLLNDARMILEEVIDVLHEPHVGTVKKPRDYRNKARKAFLTFTKARKPKMKKVRIHLRKQLGFVGRDLKIIEKMIQTCDLGLLSKSLYQKLLVVNELYRQQRKMYIEKEHRVDDRIVSIHMPHIRPIVRGKAGADTEFGAKVLISVQNGFNRIEHLDFNSFNEGNYLQAAAENYFQRNGHYPARILVDKIFRTRENYRFCKQNNIKMSNVKLGRPPLNMTAEQKQEERDTEGLRNEVEGDFGTGKRKYTLNRLLTRLPVTSICQIALVFMVMNLDKVFRDFLFSIFKVRCLKDLLEHILNCVNLTRKIAVFQ